MKLKEGKVYRLRDDPFHQGFAAKRGWLWVYEGWDTREHGHLFKSIATGVQMAVNSPEGRFEEAEDEA